MDEISDIKHVEFIDVPHISEVGAGTSVEYLPYIRKRRIRKVKNARPSDRFISTRIAGDSLSGHGIFDGDHAICRITFDMSEVTDGRLVVARTPGGRVVKHFHLTEDGRIRLESANPHYKDLYYELQDVVIEALVIRTEKDWE